MSIPLFMLAGQLMMRGGIMDRLIDFANAFVGRVRGGLGHVTVVDRDGLVLSLGYRRRRCDSARGNAWTRALEGLWPAIQRRTGRLGLQPWADHSATAPA